MSSGSDALSDPTGSEPRKTRAMLGNEVRTGVIPRIDRKPDFLSRRREELQQVGRHLVVRYEQAKVVVECDEMPVEQPMGRSRECHTVGYDVGSAIGDGPDMGRLCLRFPATIDDPQSRDGAGAVIGIENLIAETGCTDFLVHQDLLDPAFAKFIGQQRGGCIVDVLLVELEPDPVVRVERLAQPLIDDGNEIIAIERAHRFAAERPSGIARTGHVAKEALGEASVLIAVGHRVIEG